MRVIQPPVAVAAAAAAVTNETMTTTTNNIATTNETTMLQTALESSSVSTSTTTATTTIDDVKSMYRSHLDRPALVFEEYVIDMHTVAGRRAGRGLEHFASSGSVLMNEDRSLLQRTNLGKRSFDDNRQ